MTESSRFDRVIAAIDAANARDPNRVEAEGQSEPAELVYGRRMSAALARMAPDASEQLRIAVRGQHIERWGWSSERYAVVRSNYVTRRREPVKYDARRFG